jgi:RNA polymerase sigma-70 factor (ECF subfamily)
MDGQIKILVKRIKNGDKDAFAEFYRLTVRFTYSIVYAYLLSKEDTEDVIQNTYLKLYRIRNRIDTEQKVMAYLKRITVNYALKQIKQRKMVAPKKHLPSNDSEVKDTIHNALEKLNERDRLVISLYYLSNASIKEISLLIRERESTVKTRLFRARNKLREVLKNEL